MKKLLLLAAGLALVGAGCQAVDVETSEPIVLREQPITQPAPEPITQPVTQPTVNRNYDAFPGTLPADKLENRTATIQMEAGNIELEFYGDTAPLAVSNFIQLAEDGYFDTLKFHRREEGFVIQGGDPAGNGTGGPGYTFADELTDNYSYDRGVLAMANRGPATNGSQFFIMLADSGLPKAYTIFGRVTSGMDVVDGVKVGDVMTKVEVK